MRTSKDEYILPGGEIVALSQDEQVPENAKIYNGYDYHNQCWMFEGKKDVRTLEQLQDSVDSERERSLGN